MDLWSEGERRGGWEMAPAGKAAELPYGMSNKPPKLIKDVLFALLEVASFSFESTLSPSKDHRGLC